MIEYVHGALVSLSPVSAVVDVHGVGFRFGITLTTFEALKGKDEAKLFVYEIIREDAYALYGFATAGERAVFAALLGVSGVGAGTARGVLSAFSPEEVSRAVAAGDVAAIRSVKGIGLKTAQRIVVDLKDKLSPSASKQTAFAAAGRNREAADEAAAALAALGFPPASAAKAVEAVVGKFPSDDINAGQIIKLALKML